MVTTGVDLSGVLEDLLRDRDWTQERLGKETRIARPDINAFVMGRKRAGDERLARIAEALGLTPLELRELAEAVPAGSPSLSSRLESLADGVKLLLVGQERLQELLEQAVGAPQSTPAKAAPKRRKAR